jgi:copper ion binding protein
MALFKKKKQIELSVQGMTCNHCVMRVEKALSEVEGVRSVEVNLEENRATVTVASSSEPTVEALVVAVQEAGYQAELRG